MSKQLLTELIAHKENDVQPWIATNCAYLVQGGSHSYGTDTPESDIDLVGFTIPPKPTVFPHLAGEIVDFDMQKSRFAQYQQHGVVHTDGQEYDVTVYSIVKFFSLALDNNPNILENLFVPERCRLFLSDIGQLVFRHRHKFLNKKCYHRYRGFAFSQINKFKNKSRDEARLNKFGYHAVRLTLQCEQILRDGDLTLDAHSDMLQEIRQDGWSWTKLEAWFNRKERILEELYEHSDAIPYGPDEKSIKTLLLTCLEEHYGDLNGCINYGQWRAS